MSDDLIFVSLCAVVGLLNAKFDIADSNFSLQYQNWRIFKI